MLRVSLRNLQVREAFKVVPFELAMSRFLGCLFWVILLECTTSSNIPLGSEVQWRDKTCVPPCYKSVKVIVSDIILYMRVSSKRIVVSRVEV